MLPDFRIRFPSDKIDFNEDVFAGASDGQKINNFPEPGQARYDWMRMVIIGLLANQASVEEPTNYKIGTIWFSLVDNFYKYFDGNNFTDIARAIMINDISLYDWSEIVQQSIGKVTETASFSGKSESNGITEINIPSDVLKASAYANNHPILYKNQLLIDPRLTSFNIDRNKILLLTNTAGSIKLNKNDIYTILIQKLDIIVPTTVIVD
jgi:hypothetical protein